MYFLPFFLLSTLFLFSPTTTAIADEPLLLSFDQNPTITKPPRSFRFSTTRITEDTEISLEGLAELNIIGSGAFSASHLEAVSSKLSAPITVVDLRKECHAYVNKLPISWFSDQNWETLNKEPSEVNAIEQERIEALRNQRSATFHYCIKKDNLTGKITQTDHRIFNIYSVQSEEEMCAELNIDYKRFHVSDHCPPDPDQVETFIQFTKTVPEDTWLYFHCRGGVGRTTSFMLMYDMLQNAKKVSFMDLISRHILIGGKNLLKLSSPNNYKSEQAIKRVRFLIDFYTFCRIKNDPFTASWSDWLEKEGPQASQLLIHEIEELSALLEEDARLG